MPYIYRHIRLDKNEPFYIGISKKDDGYRRAFTKKNRNLIWNSIVNRIDYYVEILFEHDDLALILDKEIEFITIYGRIDLGTGTLSNLTDGGIGVYNYICVAQDKEKRSISAKKRVREIGFTDVHKENISKSKKGVAFSDLHKKKISEGKKGWCPTKEQRLNMIKSLHTPESFQKSAATRKGKPVHPNSEKARIAGRKNWIPTQESKNKQSFAHLGKKASNEAKENMSKSQKNRDKSTYTSPPVKSIIQKDLENNVVKIWESMADAGRSGFNIGHISSCCKGNRKQHKGFIWEYETP